MNILVICSDYPDKQGNRPMAYVHTRNILYQTRGSSVDVINFHTAHNYIIDGVKVYASAWLTPAKASSYDLVIMHAANIRQHYRLLKKYNRYFKKVIFFFHGHEVLKISKVYSKPYDFIGNNAIKTFLQDRYDDFKFLIWRHCFTKLAYKSSFIFVSQWMRDEFVKWIRPSADILKDRNYITYNCVGKIFEEGSFTDTNKKEFDFITIRGNLDNSKYCVDIVNELASKNPTLKFLLIGKGAFFEHYKKAPNLIWIPETLSHKEIPQYLDKAKIALMPTRTDAQGVMMCEMAAYGMPVITSDIPVCHEVFDGFKGISFIDNEDLDKVNLKQLLKDIEHLGEKNPRYYNSVVGNQEYDILEHIYQS